MGYWNIFTAILKAVLYIADIGSDSYDTYS